MRVPDGKLLSIIDTIHRAGLDPDAWQEVVDGLHALLPEAGVALHGFQAGPEPAFVAVAAGWDPALGHAYRTEWGAHNPYPALIPRMQVGVPVIADESEFIEHVRKTEFYHDFLLESDLGAAVGIPLWNDTERVCFLAIDYSVRHAARLNRVAASLASAIAPHVTRSFETSHRLATLTTGPTQLSALLRRIRGPALVVDAGRRVRSANAAAEALLRDGETLRLDRDGSVVLADSAADASLAEAVRACLGPLLSVPPCAVNFRQADNRPRSLNVVPLLADDSLARGPLARFLAQRERLALLIVTTPWEPTRHAEARLRDAFRMTPAEARLALALMEGQSLDGYARTRSIAVATARNQLQSLFEKTRTHRQGELVAALFGELR